MRIAALRLRNYFIPTVAIYVVPALAIFVFSAPVEAQEEAIGPEIYQAEQAVEPLPEAVITPSEETVSGETAEIAAPLIMTPAAPLPEVVQDTVLEAADFGATGPRILPDSPFYVFKRWGRAVRKFFIRNPVARAEEDLRVANQKLLEARRLAEQRAGDARKAILSIVDEAERDFARMAGEAANIDGADPETRDRFMDILADRTYKNQKLFERLEGLISEESLMRIRENKERALEHAGEIFSRVDDPERLAERLIAAGDAQRGSEFKQFKNLEVLKELEDRMPEEAGGAIRRAEENGLKRLKEDIESAPIQEREKLGEYVRSLPGDAAIHFEIIDDLRTKTELAPDFILALDEIKTEAAAKFQERFEELGNVPELQDAMLNRFRRGEAAGLRAAEQLRDQVPLETAERIRAAGDEGLSRFREKLAADPQALRAADFIRRALESPDAADFVVLERIRLSLPSEQQELVRQLENEAALAAAGEFERWSEEFAKSFADPNVPQALPILEDLRERLPQAREGLERAIEAQRERFEQRLRASDDPEILRNVRGAVKADERLRRALEARDPQIFRKLEGRIEDLLEDRTEEVEQAWPERDKAAPEVGPLPFGSGID